MIGRVRVALLAVGLVACGAPDEPTALRPAGPPEVLSVLVSNDTTGAGVAERATFCKLHDDKRPALIPANPDGPDQVCPEDLALGVSEADDTVPGGWYVRIQFDELLDPDKAETLIPTNGMSERGSLVDTQPVSLSCGGVTIAYDGYYNPSGNSLTWPIGPSLYVAPLDASAIATGSECDVTIGTRAVIDKDGNPVPADERGPYTFKIAPLTLVSTSPVAEDPAAPRPPPIIAATSPLSLTFNAPVDPASLTASELTIIDVASCDADPATGTPHPAVVEGDATDPRSLFVRAGDAGSGDAWLRGKTFVISPNPGADLHDLAGGVGTLDGDAAFTVCLQAGT
jgi:hypothetical protein